TPNSAASATTNRLSLAGGFMTLPQRCGSASPRGRAARRRGSDAARRVACLLDGAEHGGVVDALLAADLEAAAVEGDAHPGGARHLLVLGRHRADAVAAGHARDLVGGCAHRRSSHGPVGSLWIPPGGIGRVRHYPQGVSRARRPRTASRPGAFGGVASSPT